MIPSVPDDEAGVVLADQIVHDPISGDFFISNVSGINMKIWWRNDNKGYDITSSKHFKLPNPFDLRDLTAYVVGHQRVYPGQSVIVSDPQMEGFLPVPSLSAEESITHLPVDIVMRFSTLSASGAQVFLHASGSTATFGRDFGQTGPQNWGLGGAAVMLVLPESSNADGCSSHGPSEKFTPPTAGSYVLLLERGTCTFFEKLVLAHRAGAAGVLVVDTPESGETNHRSEQVPLDIGTLSLIRPSAEGEAEDEMRAVDSLGMMFTTHMVGEIIKRVIQVEGKVVGVELIPGETDFLGVTIDTATIPGDRQNQRPKGASAGSSTGAKEEEAPREGRLALGEWVIWNLKIVERTPP